MFGPLTDLPARFNLMRQLADVEDYLDDFSVTLAKNIAILGLLAQKNDKRRPSGRLP